MKKLLPLLRQYKREGILGPLCKLIEAVFELFVPLVMARIIDIGVKNADQGYVLRMGGLMVLLCAVGLLSALVCQYFAARASQGFGTILRNKLFAHIGGFSHAELDRFGAPTLVTRITSDVNQLQLAVAMFIRLAVRAPFLIIGAVFMAMTINAKLSLIFLAAAACIALVLYAVMSRSIPFYALVQKMLDRVSHLTRENLSGTRVIRAFSRQNQQKERFAQANDGLTAAAARAGRLSALLNPVTLLIINTAIIAILWFGNGSFKSGDLKQGELIALINYMTQILLALVVVANLAVLFSRASASAKRVNEVLETKPTVVSPIAPVSQKENAPAVEFRDVSFRYGQDEDDLTHISFKLWPGQVMGLIGGTGAGKSTLVHLIPRFYDATGGNVLVRGVDVRAYPLAQLRAGVGIAAQRVELFSGTVRDMMLFGNENATDEQIWAALQAAQAADFVRERGGLPAEILPGGRNF
ncbi:MAG TPA: ATP-binding protein, partial [Clostridiales bacterium]|nr:ATP-binding protein [Clostridiales bacterium]